MASEEARAKADGIVTEAERKASIAVQKRLTDAKTETGKLRDDNRRRLAEYTDKAEKDCAAKLGELEKTAASNSDRAVEAIISGYFS